MQVRKDPISLNWVVQEDGDTSWPNLSECPYCPGHEASEQKTLYSYPSASSDWQVRVTPHLRPLYRIEGEVERSGDGVYDRMRNLGAHEVVIESPDHQRRLSQLSDKNIAQVIR